MTAKDADRLYRVAQRRLRAGKVYNVMTLQDGLGINVLDILAAINSGEIPRSLGEGLNLCVLGCDIVDWLRERAHKQREQW